jgi:hypothetical protein
MERPWGRLRSDVERPPERPVQVPTAAAQKLALRERLMARQAAKSEA